MKWWIPLLLVAALLLGLTVMAGSVSAEDVAPASFCQGGVPWIVRNQATLPDPGCSTLGTFVLEVETVQSRHGSFAEAEEARAGRDSTYWFEPGQMQLYLPLVLRSQPVTAPSGFCSGGIPWIVPAGSAPVNPGCGRGRFAVDVERTVEWTNSWDRVLAVLNLRAGTIWFEPTSTGGER